MRRLALLTGGSLLVAQAVVVAQIPSRTVWDGVYSEAQALRGQKAFTRSCGGCHRDDASGGDDAEPALRGPSFLHRWEDASVAALYDSIASNMPRNNPGSVSLPDCADIVAYLLKLNGMPAGTPELTTNIELLDQIRITEKRPAR